jgi:hypothetical protein
MTQNYGVFIFYTCQYRPKSVACNILAELQKNIYTYISCFC